MEIHRNIRYFYYLILLFMIGCCFSCQEENWLNDKEQTSLLHYEGDNYLSRFFLKKIEEYPNHNSDLEFLLKNQNPLIEYVDLGNTSDYGIFYLLPLQDKTSGVINACLLYPIDEEQEWDKRSYYGSIGKPILIDADFLNNKINITKRFIYSLHFVNWEKQGLKVDPKLTEFAKRIDGKTMSIPEKECNIPSAIPSTKALGWVYDIVIQYEIVERRGINSSGEPYIETLPLQREREIFHNCLHAITNYESTMQFSGPYWLSYNAVTISLFTTKDVTLEIPMRVRNFMDHVMAESRFQYRYQFSFHEKSGGSGTATGPNPNISSSGSSSTQGSSGGSRQ